jgi:hypothetical protein
VEVEGYWAEMAVMVVYPAMKPVDNLDPHLVLVDHCKGKGNLLVYDSVGFNCSIPNVDPALNYLGKNSSHTSTGCQYSVDLYTGMEIFAP